MYIMSQPLELTDKGQKESFHPTNVKMLIDDRNFHFLVSFLMLVIRNVKAETETVGIFPYPPEQ